jgi:hypothetical protein
VLAPHYCRVVVRVILFFIVRLHVIAPHCRFVVRVILFFIVRLHVIAPHCRFVVRVILFFIVRLHVLAPHCRFVVCVILFFIVIANFVLFAEVKLRSSTPALPTHMSGLSGAVTVSVDGSGVIHITAATINDAVRAQGAVVAQQVG